jgi:uncharacterized phage-associated protein
MSDVTATAEPLQGAPAATVAVLAIAERLGATVTRTKLAKLLYLADLRAVEKDVAPGSGLTWIWHNYGPYDAALKWVEASLKSQGIIEVDQSETWFGNWEYRLTLCSRPQITIDREFTEIVRDIVAEFGSLGPTALRDLSYQTAPMRRVQVDPGVRGVRLDLNSDHPLPSVSRTRKKFRAVLASLPAQTDDEGALEELAAEIAELAPQRSTVNQATLGDASNDC